MPVNEKQIRITIVVIIKKFQAPAAQQLRCRSNLTGLIGKDQLLVVVLETEKLLIDIRDEKILPAIAVVVSRVDAHA